MTYRPVDFDPFASEDVAFAAPSTESQRELWTSAQMGIEASLAYNESVSLRFKGELDFAAMEKAFVALVKRHESLRSTFSADGTRLLIGSGQAFQPAFVDLSVQAEPASKLKAIFKSEVETPFDLERGPLFRVKLIKMSPQESLVVMTAHHIICDGWSYAVLISDLGQLYSAYSKGRQATLEAPASFAQYAITQERREKAGEFAAAQAYWLDQFKGRVPSLDLPTDRARPVLKTYRAGREDHELNPEIMKAVKKAGAKLGCSFVATLFSAFNVLMYRLSGQEDQVVGMPSAGQSVVADGGGKNLVGHAVNLLPLYSRLDGSQKFSDYLKSMRKVVLNAYDHQEYTFGSLLKNLSIARDPSRLPLVSVQFNVDQGLDSSKLKFEGVQAEFFSNPRAYENFELFLNAVELPGRMILEMQYNADLFDAATIRRRLKEFEALLAAIAAAPDTEIQKLSILPADERAQLLSGWNQTSAEYPTDALVFDLVSQQARRTPDAIAIEASGVATTYAQLEKLSNQIARELQVVGVKPGTLVGISLDRSATMVAGMLGILKAGAAYVPLDPSFPQDRLEYMVEDSGLAVLLTQKSLLGKVPSGKSRVICVDGDASVASQSDTSLEKSAGLTSSSPAYVIYTSGSTGRPKGVQVPHGSVVNFLVSMREKPGIGAGDKLLAVTTLSFDIAVLELYLPLTVGARVLIATKEESADGMVLRDLLETQGVTMMQATPSTWRLLLAAGWDGNRALKILAGGEALPRDLIAELLPIVGSVWNMYGPTETTVWSTCHHITDAKAPILIGRPIANTQAYVLDALMQPVPIGVPGELYLGGSGVTLGYLGRPDLTQDRFVTNPFFNEVGDPFSPAVSQKLYRTGDLVRYHADGGIEYYGRNDFQVKVRGYRIELGEIESVLAEQAGVAQAIVTVREDIPGDQRLVAYVVPSNKGSLGGIDGMRTHLKTRLPEYMVPQHLVEMASLPLTNNGKVDRKALPAPQETLAAKQVESKVAPRNELEKKIAAIWSSVLGADGFGVNDDFFRLGGHSLLATRVMSRIKQETGAEVSLKHLFEAPTVARLAELVKGMGSGSAAAFDLIPRRQTADAPLSLMQQRVWYLEELNPGTAVYSLPSAFQFDGKLDLNAFKESLNDIVRRHESLRTVFRSVEGTAVQRVLSDLEFSLEPVKVSAAGLDAELDRLAKIPFDLNDGALVRAELLQLSDQRHVLFFMPHHAIFDGWSFDLFLRELVANYSARTQGKATGLKDLSIQYGDYALWHRDRIEGDAISREMGYWKKQLGGKLPVMDLPADRPRPEIMSFQGDTLPLKFPKELVQNLTKVARAEGATLFMALMAAYDVVLSRWSGANDILVGSPIQGRSHPQTEDLIGFFVNTLVMRTSLASEHAQGPTLREVLSRVRETCVGAFAHQDMPFEALVHELKIPRDLSRTPIFQAFFSYQDTTNRTWSLGDVAMSQLHLHSGVTPTDVSFWVKETGEGLSGAIDYNTDIFERATMERFLAELGDVLKALASNPDQRIGALASATPAVVVANSAVVGFASPEKFDADAPSTETELWLASLWSEALGASAVSIHDNFFHRGGHSLLSMKILAKIEKKTGLKIGPRAMLLNSLGQIAAQIDAQAKKNGAESTVVVDSRSAKSVVRSAGEPDYFGADERRLYGVFHAPDAKAARQSQAVLLCYPIAQEYMRSHWAMRRLAELLTRQGYAVLRFDYRGTGDSAGEWDQQGLEQWKEDIQAAASELKSRSGSTSVSCVALRMGALLASMSAVEWDQLVLWDPVVHGGEYLNTLKTMHLELLKRSPKRTSPAPAAESLEEMLGFAFPKALQSELASLRLAAEARRASAKRLSIVVSSDRPEYAALELPYAVASDAGDWDRSLQFDQALLVNRILNELVAAVSGGRS